jgi:type IV pilus biogenesis protein CpaD/CtpE
MHAAPPAALIRLSLIALSVFAVAGCDQMDPLKRPYMWHETEVNAHNIAAMAANPADLIRGQDQRRRRANADSDSVDRLWSGKTVPLPSDTPGATSGSSISPAGGASPGGT